MTAVSPARNKPGTSEHAGDDRRNADIVMKGGITSGVVYPGAVAALAEEYRFRSIGGTSAGAIAAAATAAAEYGRQTKNAQAAGFTGVESLPKWLGGADGERLFGFFRPQSATAPLFAVAVSFVGSARGRKHRVADALLRACWRPLLLGLLPALALALAALAGGWVSSWVLLAAGALLALVVAAVVLLPTSNEDPPRADRMIAKGTSRVPWVTVAIVLLVLPFVCGGLAEVLDLFGRLGHVEEICRQAAALLIVLYAALAIPLATALTALGRRAWTVLPDNDFGLCKGNGPGKDDDHPQLTPWLADYLDELAGLKTWKPTAPTTDASKPVGRPLTFGDLDDHQIDLQVMTTNLTAARGYRLPFDGADDWYFDPREFAELFPEKIVAWMTATSPQAIGDKRALPARADFPVVVAARMSLSFPVLLSAIPLYADRGKNGTLTKCWFSDGGIVSNFPIHFFDSPLPRWPTFAINLRGFPKNDTPKAEELADDPCKGVFLAKYEAGDDHEDWSEIGTLAGFLGSLKSALENAHDNEQMRQVGFRDRIAHVRLLPDEGGLNLKMPADRVKKLSDRGGCAGKSLRERFTAAPDQPLSWANHRWVRYRITMANIQEFLKRFERGYSYCTRPEGDPDGVCPEYQPSYQAMIDRERGDPPPHFFWGPKEQETGQKATQALLGAHMIANGDEVNLDDGRLHPHTELRNVPHA